MLPILRTVDKFPSYYPHATMFPNGLHFDIKDKIFGMDDLSPLFSVINNKKRA